MNKQGRRRLDTLGVAAKFNCHPASVPRLVKEKRLPKPDKLLHKNMWWEDVIDELVETGIPSRAKQANIEQV